MEEHQPLLGSERKSCSFSQRVLRIKSLKYRLWFNLFIYVFSYAFSTVGIGAISSVQTSIHYKDGLGATAMAVITISSLFTCFIILPIHRKLGSTWLLALSCVFYSLFCLANLYPTWPMMMTSAIIAGVGMSFGTVTLRLVTAQLAHGYCRTQGLQDRQDRVQSRMFMVNIVVYKGLLATLFPLTSLMIATGDESGSDETQRLQNNSAFLYCGAEYCNEGLAFQLNQTLSADENMDGDPDFGAVGKLVSFGVACNVFAGLLLFMVDSMESLAISEEDQPQNPIRKKKFSIGIMANPKMMLLLPVFFTSMACDMFWVSDFTAAFVTCKLGLESVGLVLMWTGVSGALSCVVFGSFNSEKFRKIPLMLSMLLPLIVLAFLLSWSMASNVFLILCILSAVWYVAGGVRLNLFPALLAVVFPDHLQSAFTVQHMWMSLGGTVVAAWSNWLCMDVKMYILIVALILSLLGYSTLEISLTIKKRNGEHGTYEPIKSS